MRVHAAARTDIGLVREGNEDAYLVDDPLYVVADGMGGHIAGDVASRTAVDVIQQRWHDGAHTDLDSLAELVRSANAAIYEMAQADPELNGMGTTCTALVVDDDEASVAHVGDSRAYLLRDGELRQVTDDHTVVNRMVHEGRLRPEEAERHPHRNILTRALGIDQDIEVDTLTVELRRGDRLLMCSDGLYGMVGPGALREMLITQEDPDAAAQRLIELAKGAGGDDNITVLVLDVLSDDAAAPPPPQPQRVDTAPDVASTPRRRRPVLRYVVVPIVILAVLAAGGYVAARVALANSWYVGTSDDGRVAIYQGLPDDVIGVSLREVVETSSLRTSDLPEFRRLDLQNGITVDSRGEAEQTIENLEREARELEEQQRRRNRN